MRSPATSRLLSGALLLGSLAAQSAPAHAMESGEVVSIIDGDNLLVNVGGQTREINLAYIRPPVGGGPQDWNALAQARLQELLPPGTKIQFDTAWVRSDGRNYAYVYSADNGLINVQMLKEGLAINGWRSPNDTIQGWYEAAEAYAATNKLGSWGTDAGTTTLADANPMPPQLGWLEGSAKTHIGVGAVALVATLMVARVAWRKGIPFARTMASARQEAARVSPKEISRQQRLLTETLASQKKLEREYHQIEQQVSDWLGRAEAALRNNNEDLAREALVRKRAVQARASSLKQALEATNAQAEQIRATISSLQLQGRNSIDLDTLA